jgi:hypothetical protein
MIQSGGNDTSTAVPGITLRDVAMALKVEHLFQTKHFLKIYGEASRPEDCPPREMRPASMSVVMYKTQRIEDLANTGKSSRPVSSPVQLYCFICKSREHSGVNCPERKKIRPPRPCGFCGGNHWQQDCEAPWREQGKQGPCQICLGIHRSTMCPKRAGPVLNIPSSKRAA